MTGPLNQDLAILVKLIDAPHHLDPPLTTMMMYHFAHTLAQLLVFNRHHFATATSEMSAGNRNKAVSH